LGSFLGAGTLGVEIKKLFGIFRGVVGEIIKRVGIIHRYRYRIMQQLLAGIIGTPQPFLLLSA